MGHVYKWQVVSTSDNDQVKAAGIGEYIIYKNYIYIYIYIYNIYHIRYIFIYNRCKFIADLHWIIKNDLFEKQLKILSLLENI